ncbi:uncharacterized protein LOC120073996 isoform X7 [Benincasa hispida]|uniref:uncharacterized protein LOC120073996 isoform X7 n=1 Tax=Benincasa hispida TaxID=102211 RepID=UPI0018FF5FC5|nr:uncharacterized protein LOC120073996 isoform X7 [Benincasa hispida]
MIRSLFFSSTFVRTTFTSFTPRFTPIPVLRCPGIGVGNSASFCSKSFSVSAKSTFFMEQAPTADEVQQVELLDATEDNHGGVIVEMDKPMDCEIFAPILRASIAHWKKQGKKGVWIKLPIELAHLVEAIVKERFWYHHAEPKYLMLVYWIPEGAHTLPVNATHRVGIGAFVLNDKKEGTAETIRPGNSHDLSFGKMIGTARHDRGLYFLFEDASSRSLSSTCLLSSLTFFEIDFLLCHFCLGHPNFHYMKYLFPHLFRNVNVLSLPCDVCIRAKQPRASFTSQP